MERVVLDPAVLVSALISPAGNPAALWDAVRDERIEIITSPWLLAELARVLARPKFRRYATMEEVEAFVEEVARYGTPLADPRTLHRSAATEPTTTSWRSPEPGMREPSSAETAT